MRKRFNRFKLATATVLPTLAASFVMSSYWPVTVHFFGLEFDSSVPQVINVKAYESTDVKIRVETPTIVRVKVVEPSGSGVGIVDVHMLARPISDDQFGALPPQKTLTLPPLGPGEYTVRLAKGELEPQLFGSRRLSVSDANLRRVNFQQAQDDVTGRFLLAPDGAWARARMPFAFFVDAPFRPWATAASDAPGGTVLVHRFTNRTSNAIAFYTSRPAEIALLQRAADFVDDGPVFRAFEPKAGACPIATMPIYRAFQAKGIATHRYTREISAYNFMVDSGDWAGEGVAFCVPKD